MLDAASLLAPLQFAFRAPNARKLFIVPLRYCTGDSSIGRRIFIYHTETRAFELFSGHLNNPRGAGLCAAVAVHGRTKAMIRRPYNDDDHPGLRSRDGSMDALVRLVFYLSRWLLLFVCFLFFF